MELEVNEALRVRIDRLVDERTDEWTAVEQGYSGAGRYRVTSDAKGYFIKIGLTPWTAATVRREAALYSVLQRSFIPELIGADLDDPPVIVLEDLGNGDWPPPWTPARIDRVLDVLGELADVQPPHHLGRLVELRNLLMRGWCEVASDPSAFLALGLCSASWLESAMPCLLEAQENFDFAGDSLAHFDVRSDNICFLGPRTVLVDWAGACIAHSLTDLVRWLPSLHDEGGPLPETILPDAPPGAVAVLAGFWAANAGRPPPPDAPRVREVQRRQLAAALRWAAHTLGLSPPLAPQGE